MATYTITAPDGQQYDVTAPDNATQDQVLSYAKANYQKATPMAVVTPQPTQQQAAPQEPPSMIERAFGLGSPLMRTIKGAVVDPLLGVNQLLANTGLFGEGIKQGATQNVQQYEEATKQARERVGSTGFDPYQLLGVVVSPINKAIPPIAATTSRTGKIVQDATTGALYGGITPTTGKTEDFASDKFTQIGLGAFLGGTIPGLVEGSKLLKSFYKSLPVSEKNKEEAFKRYVDKLAGPDKEQIIADLRNAGEIVSGSKPTTAEALATTPSGVGLIKEQQRVAASLKEAPKFITRGQEQVAAREQALTGAFGTQADLAAAKAARTAETAPLRETALAQANVYGQAAPSLEAAVAGKQQSFVGALQGEGKAATEVAQATERANTWSPIPGQPRFPGRYSPNYERAAEYKKVTEEFGNISDQRKAELNFKKLQLQSITDEGFYPLSADSLISKIDTSLSKTGEKSNQMLVNSLQSIRDKLTKYSDDNGIINSLDLYNVRKEIGDDIRSFLVQRQGTNASFGAQAAGVEKRLKSLLDESINKASGTTIWNDYLSKFASHSQKINRMEVGQELIKKLGSPLVDAEKAGVFANAVENAPQLIKRTTGVPRFEKLSDFLDGGQIKAVENVLADLSRKAKSVEIAKGVRGTTEDIVGAGENINALNVKVTAAKGILNALKFGSQAQFDKKFADLALDPTKMADFLEVVPKSNTEKLVQAMYAKLSPDNQQFLQDFVRSVKFPSQQSVTGGLIQQGVREP